MTRLLLLLYVLPSLLPPLLLGRLRFAFILFTLITAMFNTVHSALFLHSRIFIRLFLNTLLLRAYRFDPSPNYIISFLDVICYLLYNNITRSLVFTRRKRGRGRETNACFDRCSAPLLLLLVLIGEFHAASCARENISAT